jgi:hypothetical protein
LKNLIYLLNYILAFYIINSYCCNQLLFLKKAPHRRDIIDFSSPVEI